MFSFHQRFPAWDQDANRATIEFYEIIGFGEKVT